jgi:hypothetical protein
MTMASSHEKELYPDFASPSNNRPTFAADPKLWDRYGEKAIDVLKSYWGSQIHPTLRKFALENLNAEPYYKNLTIQLSDLPTIYGYRISLEQAGRVPMIKIKKVPVGKVQGVYQPGKDNLRMHYGIFNEFAADDPDREMLSKRGMEYSDPIDVGVHEGMHRLQDQTGAIHQYIKKSRRARDIIEGVATKATEYALKKTQQVYQGAQRLAEKLFEKYGFARTFVGNVPASDPIVRGEPAYSTQFAFRRLRLAYN